MHRQHLQRSPKSWHIRLCVARAGIHEQGVPSQSACTGPRYFLGSVQGVRRSNLLATRCNHLEQDWRRNEKVSECQQAIMLSRIQGEEKYSDFMGSQGLLLEEVGTSGRRI